MTRHEDHIMKTVGILGGMSAASTQIYYRTLCDLTQDRFGGLTSPDLLIRSLDFAPLAASMKAGDWAAIARSLNAEARRLCDGGAELILLASNTMHKLADQMMQGVDAPLLHIADVTAKAVVARGCASPAFIATGFTMEERFYLDRLEGQGLRPLVPDAEQRRDINRIIFDELCRNEVVPASRERYIAVVRDLAMNGADSVILGCTEVCLLLDEANTDLPLFDTTRLHCEAALDAAAL